MGGRGGVEHNNTTMGGGGGGGGGGTIRPLGVWWVKHIAINLPPMGMHWTNFIRVCLLYILYCDYHNNYQGISCQDLLHNHRQRGTKQTGIS